MKIYRCRLCGQIIVKLEDSSLPITCCNEEMEELVPKDNKLEGLEKHIPVYKIHNNKIDIQIGSILHPYKEEHYIMWILIETNQGFKVRYFNPDQPPIASFPLDKDEIVYHIYSYCNIHSLWKICACKKECKM